MREEFNKGSELDKQIYKEGESTWGCKQGVLDVGDVKDFIKEIEDYCHKNNTIPMKERYDISKLKEVFGEEQGEKMYNNFEKMSLCLTDGGWVNCMKLLKVIKEKAGGKLI